MFKINCNFVGIHMPTEAATVMTMTYSTIGPYRLLKKLGEGGMGVVYEAVHQGIGHHVAIKLLAPQFNSQSEYVSRFLNEARAAAAIDHPGIVQVIDSGRLQDGSTYLIMELLKGESLAARVQSGEQPLFHVLYIGWQIASALAAAHTAGIVHRDLKPHKFNPDEKWWEASRFPSEKLRDVKSCKSGHRIRFWIYIQAHQGRIRRQLVCHRCLRYRSSRSAATSTSFFVSLSKRGLPMMTQTNSSVASSSRRGIVAGTSSRNSSCQ
jgi:serine/threonine protein kinase